MPEYTYAVTQNVHYYRGVEMDSPDHIVELWESGEWDDSKNEVKWDRIQVFDAEGACVYDTGSAELAEVSVWTITVHSPDRDRPITLAFGTEQECWDNLRENFDPEGDGSDILDNERLAAFLNLEVEVDLHVVRLP